MAELTVDYRALTEFLLARIAETEAVARAASPGGWRYGTVESVAGGMLYDETRTIANMFYEQPEEHDGSIVRHLLGSEADANGEHIARHDPARVLARCEADRALVAIAGQIHMVENEWGGGILRALASTFRDHPEFRTEWRL